MMGWYHLSLYTRSLSPSLILGPHAHLSMWSPSQYLAIGVLCASQVEQFPHSAVGIWSYIFCVCMLSRILLNLVRVYMPSPGHICVGNPTVMVSCVYVVDFLLALSGPICGAIMPWTHSRLGWWFVGDRSIMPCILQQYLVSPIPLPVSVVVVLTVVLGRFHHAICTRNGHVNLPYTVGRQWEYLRSIPSCCHYIGLHI